MWCTWYISRQEGKCYEIRVWDFPWHKIFVGIIFNKFWCYKKLLEFQSVTKMEATI